MANINLFGKDWTNIVFEGRNKAYGAYKLRQENPKTTLLALLLGVVCIGLAFGGSVAYKSVFGEKFDSSKNDAEVEITAIALPELPEPEPPVEEIEDEPEPEPEPEQADASKSVQEEVKFLETEVKKDKDVKDEQKTSQKDFDDTKTSGREDREADKDGDFKSKGEQTGGADKGSKGDGKGDKFSEEENPNKVHTFVQKKAAPNEGLQGFFNNFIRKFNAPDVGGNVKEISVRLKFVVEKDGSFTDIQIAGADPHNIGKEAIRVLKSMPKWKPAEHNGKTVRSSFTLPIKVRVNN